MLIYIVDILLILTIALSFWDIKKGLGIFLVLLFLLPEMKIKYGALSIDKTYIIIAIFMAFLMRVFSNPKKYHLKLTPLIFLITYFFLCLLIIPLQGGLSYVTQLQIWEGDTIRTVFIPLVILGVIYVKGDVVFLNKCLLFCFIIALVYCLFLAFSSLNTNPYSLLFAYEYRDVEFMDLMTSYYIPIEGRPYGRISSVFYHPMDFAFVLGLSLFFIISLKKDLPQWAYFTIIIAILVSVVVCGVRSLIGALLVSFVVFLLLNRKIKVIILSMVFGAAFLAVVTLTPMSDYVYSVIKPNDTNSEIRGSSLEMRIVQLEGAIQETEDAILFGKGYGWDKNYIATKGEHPVIFAFESLLFSIICNSGIFGFFLWGLLVVLYYLFINKNMLLREHRILLKCMLIFYISYAIITGEYDYKQNFALMYIIIFINFYMAEKPYREARYKVDLPNTTIIE